MNEYVGAIHIHSIYSDGSGKVEDIAKAASENGLDYIILTDHNTLRALEEGYEKLYDNTFFLVGYEINDKENKNHYLALRTNEAFSTRMTAKEYVKKVNESGGFGFAAHPLEKRTHMEEHPPYPWTDWEIDDFTGIEIWNHMSEWMENLTEQNKYQFFLHPLKSIVAPNEETLKLWDELNLKRKVVAMGGVDAHAHKYNLLGFLEVEIFPYKVLFKSIRTHILTEKELKKTEDPKDFDEAKKTIYDSLEKGLSFIANDYHGDSKGFRFFAEKDGNIYQMGDLIKNYKSTTLNIKVPHSSEIKIIRNGKVIETYIGTEFNFAVKENGVYRVEVYLNEKAWIFSNHIRII
jgi:PHP domain